MKVILLEEIPSIGKMGDVIRVADGYGRNYLIPQKKAVEATARNLKEWERRKDLVKDKLGRAKKDAERFAKKIEGLSCTIAKQAGEEGKLFGSVTSMDIEESLREKGVEIDRKKIILEELIKQLGVYTVPIKLHPEVVANLKVWVVKT
ncbi:MAG: 50S ribosomal protein L9 [Pseudomonadota bacterium]